MPTYTFRRLSTGEEWTDFLSISSRDELVKDPDIEQVPVAPAIISGVAVKPDNGFRDVLKKVKSSHWGSNINTF